MSPEYADGAGVNQQFQAEPNEAGPDPKSVSKISL
jgi:hypothetical protein